MPRLAFLLVLPIVLEHRGPRRPCGVWRVGCGVLCLPTPYAHALRHTPDATRHTPHAPRPTGRAQVQVPWEPVPADSPRPRAERAFSFSSEARKRNTRAMPSTSTITRVSPRPARPPLRLAIALPFDRGARIRYHDRVPRGQAERA